MTVDEKKAAQREKQILAILNKCVHFNGVSNDACEAGVNYHALLGDQPGCFAKMPCHNEGTVQCEKRVLRNREEAELAYAKREKQIAESLNAMRAAHKDAEMKGFGKGHGGTSILKCPACPDGTLHYSVASCNGHMHAGCTTKGCVSWME